MGFIGFTSGLHAMKSTATGAAVNGLSDGQAVIGDVLSVTVADATPSWRSPTPAPTDEVASGNLWSVSGSEGTPLYVVAGLETFGPFTIRNRLDLAGWSLDLGSALSIGKVLDLGATDAEIRLTIDGMDTPFSGTSHAITSGTGTEIAVMQRNLPSNRFVLGVIAEAPELVVTGFPGVSGSQNAGETVTVGSDETLSWDDVAVMATTRETRLVIDGVPGASGDLTLPADAEGQNCDLQVRFGHMTAAGVEVTQDWATIPGQSFTIQRGFELTADGAEIVLSGGAGTTTLIVNEPPAYAGTYELHNADLASGPVMIVPPKILADVPPTLGDTLSLRPGLWGYDGDLAAPVIRYAWVRDGVEIHDAVDDSYVLQTIDGGAAITVRETATDTSGSRSAVSETISVLAKPILPFMDDFSMDTSADYTQFAGGASMVVANGTARSDGAGNGNSLVYKDLGLEANHQVRATLDTDPDVVQVFTKLSNAGADRVEIYFTSGTGQYVIRKRLAGTRYDLHVTQPGLSLSAGDILELDIHDNGAKATARRSTDGGTTFDAIHPKLSNVPVSDVPNGSGMGFRLTTNTTLSAISAANT